ncbi:hypothetical protein [Streptomyces erythrochromogenes]|nr:hypothetical protein [Streptomyces erythrochromogenes]MCX5583205.1 hypothetical protein [Streptomyces erythrochromogenes]
MATKLLAHGMGTFYKDCEHAQSPLVEVPARVQDPLPQCGR